MLGGRKTLKIFANDDAGPIAGHKKEEGRRSWDERKERKERNIARGGTRRDKGSSSRETYRPARSLAIRANNSSVRVDFAGPVAKREIKGRIFLARVTPFLRGNNELPRVSIFFPG